MTDDNAAQPFKFILKLIACYLLSSISVMFFTMGFEEGHAHVPLSSFPEYLLLSPLFPLALLVGVFEGDREVILNAVWFIANFIVGVFFFFWLPQYLFKKKESDERYL